MLWIHVTMNRYEGFLYDLAECAASRFRRATQNDDIRFAVRACFIRCCFSILAPTRISRRSMPANSRIYKVLATP